MQRTVRSMPSKSVLEAASSPLPPEAARETLPRTPEPRTSQQIPKQDDRVAGTLLHKAVMIFIAGSIFGALCMGIADAYLTAGSAGSPQSGRKAAMYQQLATADCSRLAQEFGKCTQKVKQQSLLEEKLTQTQEALAGAKRKFAEALAGAKRKQAEIDAQAEAPSKHSEQQMQRLEEYMQQCKADVEGCKDEFGKLTWNAAACVTVALIAAVAIGLGLPSFQARHWHTAITRLKAENLELKGRHRWH